MRAGAAQAWFIAGTIPLILAGGLHVVLTLADTAHSTACFTVATVLSA